MLRLAAVVVCISILTMMRCMRVRVRVCRSWVARCDNATFFFFLRHFLVKTPPFAKTGSGHKPGQEFQHKRSLVSGSVGSFLPSSPWRAAASATPEASAASPTDDNNAATSPAGEGETVVEVQGLSAKEKAQRERATQELAAAAGAGKGEWV